MTPRTRSSNKDANFKVYYSEKVPQQIRFPHRRKVVRRPSAAAKYGEDKKQMRFLPEKMRVRRDAVDSEEEDDEDEDEENEEDGGVAIGSEDGEEENTSGDKTVTGRDRKRQRETIKFESGDDDEEPVRPTPKRRRTAAGPRSKRRSRQVEPESGNEADATSSHTRQEVDRSRTLRRQSTMTQLVEGRRPMSDTEEPAFKPVKRGPRLSWGGQSRKAKDKKQRTLTQMVPGMKPLEIVSDEDMEEGLSDKEAEEKDSQAYGEAIAARLAQEGLIQEKSDEIEGEHSEGMNNAGDDSAPADSLIAPSVVVHSIEDNTDEDEQSYQPTQFIEAPSTRTRRSPRRTFAVKPQAPQPTKPLPTETRKTAKSKFGLLSTPEKRRIREIPSSQSPPESPLSTQVSPSKAHRSPLQERSGNTTQVVDTPSKRKQVTFQIPTKVPIPPPTLRKFRSVIQDSEDEEDDLIEEDKDRSGHHVGAHTQALVQNLHNTAHGRDIGTETQAVLDQIDHACADANEDADRRSRDSSEELGVSIFDREYESSPELGDLLQPRNAHQMEDSYRTAHVGVKQEPAHGDDMSDPVVPELSLEQEVHSPYRTAHAGVKQEQSHSDALLGDTHVPLDSELVSTSTELPSTTQVPSSPPIIQQPVEDTCPSTPLVIMDSSDEEDEPGPTPPPKSTHTITQASSHTLQQSADLNGESVQVPRSPTAQPDTQHSHSSKAEQQLQNEWFSYSQYVEARPTHTSSMNVAHDKFSYDATFKPAAAPHYMSQATTVDEVTPRKNRTQHTISTHTTPRKIASSQPFSSPSKPPPLFIPSSFPSPAKARMDEWSSPVYGRTQDTGYNGGSLEDFSIPLPPPLMVEEDDDD